MKKRDKKDVAAARKAKLTIARAERYAQRRDRGARRRTVVFMGIALALAAVVSTLVVKGVWDRQAAIAAEYAEEQRHARQEALRRQAAVLAQLEAEQTAAAERLAALRAEEESRREAAERARAAAAQEAASREAEARQAAALAPGETEMTPARQTSRTPPSLDADREIAAAAPVEAPRCVAALTGAAATLVFFFESRSAAMTRDQEAAARSLGRLLTGCPGVRLEIEGHADPTGDETLNLQLSWRRAEAVTAAVSAVDPTLAERVRPVGFGSRRLRNSENTPAARDENRRVEFRVETDDDA